VSGAKTRAVAAAGFGLAALLAAWTPLAAPFGLAVGLAALLLCLRALRRGGARVVATVGLVLAVAAVALSAVLLARTAGVGRDPVGDPVVSGPSREEAERTLDEAAERTRAARERARSELSGVTAEPAPKGKGDRK
jgi:hypothetical protein